MDKKKKNMQSKTAGSKKNTIATLGRIDNPYVRNIIANEMVEMRSDGSAVRPVLPILYNIYCLDFSNTCYPPILEKLSMVAWALSKKPNMRTFLYEDTIYVATSHPISFVESALREVGEMFIDMLETLAPFINR